MEDSIKYAFHGWTNQREIICKIKSGASDPDSLKYDIKYDNDIYHSYWIPVEIEADSTIAQQIELPNNLNTQFTISCQLKNGYGEGNFDSAFIKLDTIRPIINSIICDTIVDSFNLNLRVEGDDFQRVLISEDPDISTDNETTKFYWNLSNGQKISFPLSSGEGEKTIYVSCADLAGNWAEAILKKVTVDTTKPEITCIEPECGFIHADSNLVKVKICFDELVSPSNNQSWSKSIFLYDLYANYIFSPDSIYPSSNYFTDSLTIFSKRMSNPSHYFIKVHDFEDVFGHEGKSDSCNYYVFMEKERGGNVKRIINDQKTFDIEVSIDPNALPSDAVFILEPLIGYYENTEFNKGINRFELMDNSIWRINAINRNYINVDSLLKLNAKANIKIFIEHNSDLDVNELQNLRMMKFDFTENLWLLLNESRFLNDFVIYDQSTKISGIYAIFKQVKNDIIDIYPNPFNPLDSEHNYTTIRFSLSEGENVDKIRIFDIYGNLVKTIDENDHFSPVVGVNEVRWDGKNDDEKIVANGGYVCYVKKGLFGKIAVLKK